MATTYISALEAHNSPDRDWHLQGLVKKMEQCLLQLHRTGFDYTCRDKKKSGAKPIQQQLGFTLSNSSVRTHNQSGFVVDGDTVVYHNIPELRAKHLAVNKKHPREKSVHGNAEQRQLQLRLWSLAMQFVGVTRGELREWAWHDVNMQFSLMTDCEAHRVGTHVDGDGISHQYGIAFGDFDSGPLMVNGTPYEYKNRLLKFDGRIEHSVPVWSGNYRCNLFFYKHYDRRWTKPDPLLAAPSYVLDLEPTGTREPPQKRQRVN